MGGNGGILFFGVLLKKRYDYETDEELMKKYGDKKNPIQTFSPYDGGDGGGLYLIITKSFITQVEGPFQLPIDNSNYLKQLMDFTSDNKIKINPTKIGWWFMEHEIY